MKMSRFHLFITIVVSFMLKSIIAQSDFSDEIIVYIKDGLQKGKSNQVELGKQFLGTWKSEVAKDTFNIWEQKLFATGMEATIKIVTKGKIITEGKAIIGYDKKNDKLIESDLLEGSGIMVYAFWFTSKNACIQIPYEYISNPEQAPSRTTFEFKSPDLFIETYSENNKVVAVYKNIRVK